MSDIARLVPRLSMTERLILDLLRESEQFGLPAPSIVQRARSGAAPFM